MRIKHLAGATVLAMAVAGHAQPAAAAEPLADCDREGMEVCIDTYDDNPGAHMEYDRYNNEVWLCDTDSDGKRAVGKVKTSSGNGWKLQYTIYDEHDDGSCNFKDADSGDRFDLPNYADVWIEVCVDEGPNTRDQFCTVGIELW